jgi:hypothetical protein
MSADVLMMLKTVDEPIWLVIRLLVSPLALITKGWLVNESAPIVPLPTPVYLYVMGADTALDVSALTNPNTSPATRSRRIDTHRSRDEMYREFSISTLSSVNTLRVTLSRINFICLILRFSN